MVSTSESLASSSPSPMGIRAYARRRGVTQTAVSLAVKSGRLKASVVRVNGAPKIADPDLADREWRDGTNAAMVRSPHRTDPSGITMAEACRDQKIWQARKAELEYRQAAGELVDRRELTTRWADVCTRVRTRLMGVPGKIKARHPELSLEQVAELTAGIREALEDLADGGILRS